MTPLFRYFSLLLLTFCTFLAVAPATAQLKLPQPSPAAFVKHTIGLTDVAVRYHAPGVKNRKIFGTLVPYGTLWRAGANEATLITFTDEVFLNQERVPAGTYSFFILPESDSLWHVVLNRDTTLWGLEGYDELEDVAYLRVKPERIPFQETMTFSFSDVKTNTGSLHMSWENSRVTLRIETEIEKKALENIKAALATAKEDDWYTWALAADFMIPRKEHHLKALEWINKSIAIKETFFNNWVKAKLYAQNKEYEMAASLTEKAMKLGKAEPEAQEEYKTYERDIMTAHHAWKRRKL
jgi:tetratricopeptide (TPR) repeat protein